MNAEIRTRTVFLTGQPGVGKTTLIRKLHEHFVKRGVMVSGVLTEESRTDEVRTGFRIRSLGSGEEGWLATKTLHKGPRVGSYFVNTLDLEHIGAGNLQSAVRGDARLVLIDEVGPMEMTSSMFRRALEEVLLSKKTTVASVKYGSHYHEVEEASRRKGTMFMTVTHENRDSMFSSLIDVINESMSGD